MSDECHNSVVDDLVGLDRLDGWLNGQRGKLRLLLLWLEAYPLAFIVSVVLWAWWAFEPDADLTVLAAVAVGLPVAVPVAFVRSGLHAVGAAASRKPAKVWPRLSWRVIAAGILVDVVVALQCVANADLWYGRRQAALLPGTWLTMFIGAGCLGLMLAQELYVRQVARTRAARQARGPVGIDCL
jgi:hypothetical protein